MKLSRRISSFFGTAAVFASFAATWSRGACETEAGSTSSGEETGPKDSDFTLIGQAKVVRKGLFEVGDIDGNGVLDYAWLTPKEKHSTGAIRIYLMENSTKTLSIRHIVPGKWGFVGHTLLKGDRFGESIAQIGDVNKDGIQDLAVGAPGDSETGKGKGAIYVLLMKKDGSVLSSEKISAKTDTSLGRQHVAGEEFGTVINSLEDVNGDHVKELTVGSKDGSQTMVLLNKQGKSISCLKFSTGIDTKVLEPRLSERKIRVMPLRFDGLDDDDALQISSMKPALAPQCFFNQTHCACGSFDSSSSICLDTVASEEGKTVCLQRPCSAGFKCDCDGTNLCTIKNSPESAYAVLPGTPTNPNLVYCGILINSVERTSLVEGAPVPTPAPIAVNSENAWTSTQCMCSREVDVHPGPSNCLDIASTIGGHSSCTMRQCKTDLSKMICDAAGKSVCAHESVEKEFYMKIAEPSWTPPTNHVACELIKKNIDSVACIDKCPPQP